MLKYASEPLIEALKLFREVLFGWWTGNGDMHLKNLSLLRGADGLYRLSPAYDLLCTNLVIAGDQLALSVAGNKKNVTRRQWLALATACQIPERAAKRVVKEVIAGLPQALELIERSYLPEEMRTKYGQLLRERAALL